jgi:hypothetical protein
LYLFLLIAPGRSLLRGRRGHTAYHV